MKVQLFEVFCGRKDNEELVRDECFGEPKAGVDSEGAFAGGVLGGGEKENVSFKLLRLEKLVLAVLGRLGLGMEVSLYWAWATGDQVLLLTVWKWGTELNLLRGGKEVGVS